MELLPRAASVPLRRNPPRGLAVWFVLALYSPCAAATSETVVEDIFGRRLNEAGITLVDWEGQIANPAIKVFLRPPADAMFPARAVITATEPRLYFDLPSAATATGPSKTVLFPNANAVPIHVSIFPDANGGSEEHVLSITFTSPDGSTRAQELAVHVIDQDQPQRAAEFTVNLDYSKDQTGFFADPAKRALVEQAARDWAHFFDGRNYATVAAGAERTFIWNPTGFLTGAFVNNTAAYQGFLLYVYGVSSAVPPFRSGGAPSNAGGFQSSGGVALPLRRSGSVEMETKGNYNALGWFLTAGDSDWWQPTNLGDTLNDFASIVHHEMGHALIFHPNHTRFGTAKLAGRMDDAAVVAYHGSAPPIDATDHLPGAIDRLSGKGAFGSEYFGTVPIRRWLITRLDLLVAQAIGYTLRETSPFVPLAITTAAMPAGVIDANYSSAIAARGGVPFYRWAVKTGALPPGLALNSFTGVVSGRPTSVGTFPFTLELADYDPQTPPVTASFSIRVTTLADVLVAPAIATQPRDESLTAGGSATLAVAATGTGPLTYQWHKDGAAMQGATNATLALSNVTLAAAGTYHVVVANPAGSVTSAAARVTVAAAGPTARLSNLSVRTALANGENLIVGFFVDGGPHNVLVRAAGPALAALGVTGAVTDPRLEIYAGTNPPLANDDWAASLVDAFASVGAFQFSAGSKDAAFQHEVRAGASVHARATSAGIMLVEVYDLDSGQSPRLTNLSARNHVGTGDDILIAGFNIAGTASKRLLIRAVGPKLAAFGVGNFLADPVLAVFDGSTAIATNDNWEPALSATFAAVGAFPLDAGSRDAALLTMLPPRGYTVQVRGSTAATGQALIEIYEVP